MVVTRSQDQRRQREQNEDEAHLSQDQGDAIHHRIGNQLLSQSERTNGGTVRPLADTENTNREHVQPSTGRVFDAPPLSPSNTTNRGPVRPLADNNASQGQGPRAPSVRSSSHAARIRAAEFRMSQRLADIRLEELRIEAEMVKKQLGVDIDKINAEEEEERYVGSVQNSQQRVESWLRDTRNIITDPRETRSIITDPASSTSNRETRNIITDPYQPPDFSVQRGEQRYERSPDREPLPKERRQGKRLRELSPVYAPDGGKEEPRERWRYYRQAQVRSPEPEREVPMEERQYCERVPEPLRVGQRETERHYEYSPTRVPAQGRKQSEPERRHSRSPTRALRRECRRRSSSRIIEGITDALHDLAVSKPAPRNTFEIPVFSGEQSEWLPFLAAIRASTRYKLSPDEILDRLRVCLRGEARDMVSAMLYVDTTPNSIIDTLKQYYGRPEKLVAQTMKEISSLPRPGTTADELNNFAVKLQNAVKVLNTIEQEDYLRTPMLAREVTNKLSPHLVSRWAEYASNHRRPGEPEIFVLSRFLMQEADRAMRFSYTVTTIAASKKEAKPAIKGTAKKQAVRAPIYNAVAEGKQSCIKCNNDHGLHNCEAFKKMTIEDRWELVRKARLCFKCLKSRHRRSFCKARCCGLEGCKRPHHQLLHCEEPKRDTKPEGHTAAETVMSTTATSEPERAVLLKICPVTVAGPLGEVNTFALLDDGATISLIDEEISRRITNETNPSPLIIHGVGASQMLTTSNRVDIKIKGREEKRCHDLHARTVANMKIRPQAIPRGVKKYKHLGDLGNACYDYATPHVLVGADHWHLLVSQEIRMGSHSEPAVSRTALGWVIYGTVPRRIMVSDEEEGTVLHIISTQPTELKQRDERLENLIKTHYDIDALGVSLAVKMRPEEERAVQIFEKTVRRVNKRMEVGLPWRDDDVSTPPSYREALKRLKGIERQMDREPVYREQYTAQVNNLLVKGYAKLCEGRIESDVKWYLPHFGVRNPNKPGKLRLVFDAAGRANGVCLNDYLLEGPDRLRALPGVLFRFRERSIAVTADIEEMFLQIKIRKEDQPALMFLWRGDDRNSHPRQYMMTSLIFGACCSPFIAHSARDKNASDFEQQYPEAARAIRENHYMDDYLDSFDTIEEANQRIKEVIHVHEQASFNLRGWNSSAAAVLASLPKEKLARTANVDIGTRPDQTDKTLGLQWDTARDEIGFRTKMPRVPEEVRLQKRVPTKREALSVVMSVFDPLGLISQYTITAKVILQQLWVKKVGWDDELPTEEAEDFAQWMIMIDAVTQLKIPRAYEPAAEIAERQLHVFCDASEQAYATAAYWRTKYKNGKVNVSLIAAKSKVAPLKTQTIPRLELQAAVIGVRLAETIKNEHRIQASRTTYWTDSSTIICWIRGNARKNTPFVNHRLGEIAQHTEPEDWRWLPTDLNVADEATRAHFTPPSCKSRWYRGPEFLYEEEEHWPSCYNEEGAEDDKEEQVNHVNENPTRALPDPRRVSSYTRLINITARVILFIEKLKTRDHTLQLEVRHLEQAERLHVIAAQEENFSEEIHCLKKSRPIPRSSRLYRIDPELHDGILKVRGRINAANIESDMKKPIILDGKHPFTKLLLQREHAAAQHANNERIINEVRQKYWVLNLRPAVRATARKCPVCRVYKAKPKTPVRGDLPRSRLDAFQRPFTNCGIDFFGPMIVKIGRRREKRWGALFTCLVTRAVHIELVPSLNTDSAIMALRRMASRRGWPRVIWSDNATNFRGADRELQAAYEEWLPHLCEYGLSQRTQWRFIAPGAPHQGGAWERLVRSIKTTLAAILREKVPSEEVLQTLLCEAEHAVNSRPLTHVSVDPRDPETLTPNHFLLGTSSGLPITGQVHQNERRLWKTTQALADEYWRRWVREYLPTLIPRGESDDQARPIQTGDLVIVVDPNLPRNTWPRGVVEKLWPGPDGKIRQVDVRTKGGVFRRPVSRLVILDLEATSEELRRGESVNDGRNT